MKIGFDFLCVADACDFDLYHLGQLMNEGHSLVLVVDGPEMKTASESWLKKHLADLPASLKVQVFEAFSLREFDIYIGIDPDQVSALVETVPNLFLLSRPWNQIETLSDQVERIDSWWEIYNFVRYEYEPARR